MIAHGRSVDRPDISFLLTEPDMEKGDYFTCFIAVPPSRTLVGFSSISVTCPPPPLPAMVALNPNSRQSSLPTTPLLPVKLSRQRSFHDSNQPSPTFQTYDIPLEDLVILNDSDSGIVVRIPYPTHSHKTVEMDKSPSLCRSQCVINLSVLHTKGEDNEESIQCLVPLPPLRHCPNRFRRRYICFPNQASSLFALLLDAFPLNTLDEMWALVWECMVLLDSGCCDQWSLTHCMNVLIMETKIRARHPIVFVCLSQAIFRHFHFVFGGHSAKLDSSCFPCSARDVMVLKQQLLKAHSLGGKHIVHMFREGLLNLVQFDAETFPFCTFASLPCAIYLEEVFKLEIPKECYRQQQVRILSLANVKRDVFSMLETKVQELQAIAFQHAPPLLEELYLTFMKEIRVFATAQDHVFRLEKALDLPSSSTPLDSPDDKQEMTEFISALETDKHQLAMVSDHMLRKSNEWRTFFQRILGVSIICDSQKIVFPENDGRRMPVFQMLSPNGEIQHKEIPENDSVGQIACVEVHGVHYSVSMWSCTELLVSNVFTQKNRQVSLGAIKLCLGHPFLHQARICALSSSLVDPTSFLLAYQLPTTGGKRRCYVARIKFVNEEVLSLLYSTTISNAEDIGCVGEFLNGTLLCAERDKIDFHLIHNPITGAGIKLARKGVRDGPSGTCELDSPSHAFVFNPMSHEILFTSKAAPGILGASVRSIDSSGRIRTLFSWKPTSSATVRFTGLIPPIPNSASSSLFVLCGTWMVQFDEVAPFKYNFVKRSESLQDVPSHVSFRSLSFNSVFLSTVKRYAVGSCALLTETQNATQTRWEEECASAWHIAMGSFAYSATVLLSKLEQVSSTLERRMDTDLVPRLDREISLAFESMLVHTEVSALLDSIGLFLVAAPNLTTVLALWNHVNVPAHDFNRDVQNRVNLFVESYSWPARLFAQDFLSLLTLVQRNVLAMKTLVAVFDSRYFYASLVQGVELLSLCLLENKGFDSEILRLPVMHWLFRVEPSSVSSRPLPVLVQLKKCFHFWDRHLGSADKQSTAATTTFKWLVSAHAKTICARRVSCLRALLYWDTNFTPINSPSLDIVRRNVVFIFGQSFQESLQKSLRSALLDRAGGMHTRVWFVDPSFDFLSTGTLPTNLDSHVTTFQECTSQPHLGSSNSAIFEFSGMFEAAGSGTYLFAWASPSSNASSQALAWLSVGSPSFEKMKLNQLVAKDLQEGEHTFQLRCFSKIKDCRLVVEGPYTKKNAQTRLSHPESQLTYPSGLCFFAPSWLQQPKSAQGMYGRIVWELIQNHFSSVSLKEEGGPYKSVFFTKPKISALMLVDELLEMGGETCQMLSNLVENHDCSESLLSHFLTQLQHNLHEFTKLVETEKLPVHQLERISPQKHFFALSLREENFSLRIDASLQQLLIFMKHLERISLLLTRLEEVVLEEEETEFRQRVETTLRNFKRLRMCDLTHFLTLEVSPMFRYDSESTKEELVFLEERHAHAFFKHLWKQFVPATTTTTEGEDGRFLLGQNLEKRIQFILKHHHAVLNRIQSLSIAFEEMIGLGIPLYSEQSLSEFSPLPSRALECLHRFILLCKLRQHAGAACTNLTVLSTLVEDSTENQLFQQGMVQAIGNTEALLAKWEEEGVFARKTLKDVEGIMATDSYLVSVPSILFDLHPHICEQVAESLALFLWFRKIPNDQEFASGIEMAFTKPELEVPRELWNAEKGSVDESLLSFLSDIRSSLHLLIFGENMPFNTLAGLFQALRLTFADNRTICTQAGQVQLANKLAQVNEKRRALMQLLSGGDGMQNNNNNESFNQLLFLQSQRATWQVKDGEGVFLQYEGKKVDRELLADLQSTLVLGSTMREDDFVLDLSSMFVEELNLLDAIFHLCHKLQLAGHVSFQHVHLELLAFEALNAKLLKETSDVLELLLDQWESVVLTRFRHDFPLLHRFTIRQVVHMMLHVNVKLPRAQELLHFPLLTTRAEIPPKEDFDASLLMCCDTGFQHVNPQQLWSTLQQSMMESESTSLRRPEEWLQEFGKQLTMHWTPFWRKQCTIPSPLPSDNTSKRSPFMVAKVMRVSDQLALDVLFTAYKEAGSFPDRYTCVAVNKRVVSLDSVLNLLRRWQGETDSTCLYTVLFAHNLSFEDQRSIGHFLSTTSQHPRQSPSPGLLFLVKHECLLETMFSSSGRVNILPLPLKQLREFVCSSLGARNVEALSFASKLPGQGKTFQIQTLAFPQKLHLFRINALDRFHDLINRAKTSQECIHVEISDSACRDHEELTTLLFDLLFLNGLLDESSAHSFVWQGKRRFFVEVPSGAPPLRLAKLLDYRIVVPSISSFAAGFDSLKIGMGEVDFYSPRCDGTRSIY